MRPKILLIEDDDSFVDSVRLMLRQHEVDIVWAPCGSDGIKAYRRNIHSFATVIIDYCLPDIKGSEIGQLIRKINPQQDILFATGHREPEYLIDLLETGGSRSFLLKGRPIDETRNRILESISIYKSQGRVIGADDYSPSQAEAKLRAEGFVGRSQSMLQVLAKIIKYRESPYPTLIVGETGTGKELVAKALVPKGKNLISINCARFIQSEHLLESELFGYVKGAFTGAEKDKPGLLTNAHDQVVFLDELHELSVSSQAKLLRFLQEMKYRRVGDHSGREIPVDFKLVAATKPDIYARVKDGRFLEDLLHRVGQLEISISPLRERTEDLEPLVRHIQDEFNTGKSPLQQKQIRISTINEMAKHPWSGNVRQLQNAIRQMLTDCTNDIVDPSGFQAFLDKRSSMPTDSKAELRSLEDSMRQFEIEQITNTLRKSRTRFEAAGRLGLPASTFTRKLTSFGIDPDLFLLNTHKEEKVC